MAYQDFEVRIQADGEKGYKAEVLQSSFGRGSAPFVPPFTDPKGPQLIEIPEMFDRLRNGKKKDTDLAPEAIGDALYRSLFVGEVGELFQKSLSHYEGGNGMGVRIRLSFDLEGPSLLPVAALPWELLWNAKRRDFLSQMRGTPIVRYLPDIDRPPLPPFVGPLRVLVVQSAPLDLKPLDLGRECCAIWRALQVDSEVEVRTLRNPTLADLRMKLLDETWHVLHFMGHGGFDEETGEGHLCFLDSKGNCDAVTGALLGNHLKNVRDLRLVFLNACKSGEMPRHTGQDPYSGTALALIKAGIPAAIANQTPIYDRPAIELSATVYSRVAKGDPIDAALVEGRLAITRARSLDWATPLLFTRVPDGDILGPIHKDVERGSSPQASKSPLRLGIRSFAEAEATVSFGEEMEWECDNVLDLREYFGGEGGRQIKDPALWQSAIVPRLRDFVAEARFSRRPLHLNFAAHSSIAFAAGYFLEAKSGLDITLRQRGKGGTQEWRVDADVSREKLSFQRQKDLPGDANASDVALAVSITQDVIRDVQEYLSSSGLAVNRVMRATIPKEPGQMSVRDGSHAWRLAEILAAKIRDRTAKEREGVLHLFAATPNALLFSLGQLSRGLGRIQLYEYNFGGKVQSYTPSILLPPASKS